MNLKSIRRVLPALLVPFVFLVFSAHAQEQSAPVLINVNQVNLKAGGQADFRALHRELSGPSAREAGDPWRLISSSIYGDSFQFVVASPLQNYAQLDSRTFSGNDIGGALFEGAVESRRSFVLQVREEMGIPGEGVMPLRRLVRFQVSQGNIIPFEEFWLDTVRPALEEAGITGYQVFQTVLGGVQGEYFSGLYLPNFAALDSMNLNALLSEREQRRFGDLVDELEVTLVRIENDLSYGLPGL